MKYITLNIVLLCTVINTIFSQANSGVVTYNVSLNFTIEKLLQEEKKQNKRLKTMRKIMNNAKNSEIVLNFNGTSSSSAVSKRMVINEEKNGLDFVYSRSGRDKKYLTNLVTNTNEILECKLLEKCYLIKQPLIKWKLTQERKIIGGYLCYKAINTSSTNKKQKPIAWYTPEIPASFGPKQFFGLPGLILELEESAVVFKVKEIVQNPKQKIVVKALKGIKITKKAYNKKLKTAYSEFYKN